MKTGIQPRHRGLCQRLLTDGALPQSVCSQSFTKALVSLMNTNVVQWRKVGGGKRLEVVNPTGFQRWFSQHFPSAEIAEKTASQINAVAQFRNAKALPSDLPEIVCIRSTCDGGLLCNGEIVETTQATKKHGVFAFVLSVEQKFSLCGKCALIENLAVFHSFEKLGLASTLAIWTGGISSNRFINWLAENIPGGLQVLHLPDYDPVGLSEFLRQHEKLGEAVTLFLPDNLKALFQQHCNISLLADDKNQRILLQLRKATHPTVQSVVALIDEFNGGLEQEALLIQRRKPQF